MNHEQIFSLEAILTDFITNAEISVPNTEIQNFFKQSRIILADGVSGSRKWDDKKTTLLTGSGYIWDFYAGKVQRFSENVIAIEIRFVF